jgi:hypothetical protein
MSILVKGNGRVVFGPKPTIITDGLIFNLDAASPISYPKSGNTWFDISGNNNGTLVNTPTFDSSDGGSILFDGISDRVEISPIGSTITGLTYGTISMWFKIPSTGAPSTNGALFTVYEGTSARYGLIIGEATNNQPNESLMSLFINESIEYASTVQKGHTYYFDDTWHNIVFTVDSGPTPNTKIYIDGIIQILSYPFGSNSGVGFTNLSPTIITLGSGYYAGVYNRPFVGNIANASIYNRAITSEEQLFNYNTLKGRFGL